MLLELHYINAGIEVSDEFFDDVKCFTITTNKLNDWQKDDLLIAENNKVNKAEFHKILAEKIYYKQGQLLSYFKVEIDKLPEDMKWFSWLIFHNFNFLTNSKVAYGDRQKKIKEFLEFKRGK